MTVVEGQVAEEIEAFHDFVVGWFNGTLPCDGAVFASAIEQRLDPSFYNVQPAGIVLSRDDLIASIRSGYAKNPDFMISISEVIVRRTLAKDLILVTYVEHQRGARNSAPENGRLSTVLLQANQNAFTWLFVHETWLPKPSQTTQSC